MSEHKYQRAGVLVAALFLYVIVSATVGLRWLQRQNKMYDVLCNGHWVIWVLTVMCHLVGLGQVPLSIDMAVEKWRARFATEADKDAEQRLAIKMKHFVSSTLLQAFLGKLSIREWMRGKTLHRINYTEAETASNRLKEILKGNMKTALRH